MKYYIGKYWQMMNDEDAAVREEGHRLWDEAVNRYDWPSVKARLPKGFLKIYEANWAFHDFRIDSVSMINGDRRRSRLELCVSLEERAYRITLSGVKSLNVSIPDSRYWVFGNLAWGYAEFERDADRLWTMGILCDFECEITARFTGISAEKIKV